jgi:hypothetical protein
LKKAIGTGIVALALAAQALADSQAGVTVYPGARADPAVAAQVKKAMNIDGHTYRTADSVEKVAAFYRSQQLKEAPGTSKTGAMFMGKGVTVTVQNPWADMQTGKVNNDTLISIVKGK